ncbi:MAG: ribosome-binding factor A [SAR324 cluster bacterium]|nr:ribosome-binding factor A [SAR324 cluster bacterium]
MQTSRSLERRQKLIQQKLVDILRRNFSHARLHEITITRVQLDPSLGNAKIFYLPFSDANHEMITADLKHKIIPLQNKLYQSLSFKKSLKLTFIYDKGLSHSLKIDQRLNELGYATYESNKDD